MSIKMYARDERDLKFAFVYGGCWGAIQAKMKDTVANQIMDGR